MTRQQRITAQEERVLELLMQDPNRRYHGLDIQREAGLRRGALYPTLANLEHAGLLMSGWEEADPAVAGRRPRRYYLLSDESAMQALEALREVEHRVQMRLGVVGM
ncbi:MAG: PadR family transcriptional regulator [Egibacteraceae bacterium]